MLIYLCVDMETGESEADAARPPKPKRTPSGRKEDGVTHGRVAKPEKRRGGPRRVNSTGTRRTQSRPRSRTSTPQPADSGTPVVDASVTIFEKLSPSAREASPPAKIRYPSARMSISEMNRRAKQILEYISSIQVELATKDASITVDACALVTSALASVGKLKPAAITIPERTSDDGGPSSSLSSASTLPLDDAPPMTDGEKGVAEEAIEKMKKRAGEQSSLEIMDVLTRELIRFQRRFGAMHDYGRHGRGRHRDGLDDTASDGEGRVTRSREASAGSTGILPERRAAHA